MWVGVPRETQFGERRVAIIPASVPALEKSGVQVMVETAAGELAGFPDQAYRDAGATIAETREELFRQVQILTHVWALGANPVAGRPDIELVRSGQAVIGFCHPISGCSAARDLAECGVMLFSMELIPRITRAQSMDALSSMGTIAGYKAVLEAANTLPRLFPMMMTAAGTLAAARVMVVGAGVAGLQAIATARKLGAVVEAYDVRPVVKEQVQSLGAKFVELDLETDDAEDTGGYAKEQTEDFMRRQREALTRVVAGNDVVITTAAVPGKKAPVIITRTMVEAMAPGSVIVDLAAERGGNCEVTRPGETITHQGVTVIGPLNVPASMPNHASQMYSRNMTAFLQHLVKDGEFILDLEDEITAATLVTRQGEIVNPWVQKAMAEATRERSSA